MKHPKEYAILAVVILALGLYLFLRDTDRTTYTLPNQQAIETQDITRIEIAKADRTVALTRNGDGWQVAPGGHPADAAQVQRILDALSALELTALVSETRNYGRYELDEPHRIQVKAYKDEKVLRALNIGKAADTMRHTHITLMDDPNVYHARGNFRNDFDLSVADLRDKTVLAFDAHAVTAFAIETDTVKVTFERTAANAPGEDEQAATTPAEDKAASVQWQSDDGRILEAEKVDRLLGALSNLQCRAYLTDQSRDDLGEPAYRIRVEAEDTSRLEVFAPSEESATEIPAVSSLRTDPFMLSDFDIDPVEEFLSALKDKEEAATP